MNKWILFKGDIHAEFLPLIGEPFDFVFIDNAHYTPGELINLIKVLPFVKPGAVIAFHDIMHYLSSYRKKGNAKYLVSGRYNEICI